MGIEVVALTSLAVSAVSATAVGILNYEASQHQSAAEKSLRDEQAAQLKSEADARSAAAAAYATTGQTFGDRVPESFSTGLGFGTGTPSGAPNSSRALLTGMG